MRKAAVIYTASCLLTALACCVASMYNRDEDNPFEDMSLRCIMQLGKDIRNSKGLLNGFNYELLEEFAQEMDCSADISSVDRRYSLADSLKSGVLDIAVTERPLPHDSMLVSISIDSVSHWTVSTDKRWILDYAGAWISEKMAGEDFDSLKTVFFTHYNPHRKAAKNIRVERISPYDEIIKEYADSIGWDWRMLAAIIWQESRFSINTSSHGGAKGLMQITPRSARKFKVSNPLNPRENIRAGAGHLAVLQKKYAGINGEDRMKFILAAYNAGSGRMKSSMDLVRKSGMEECRWDDILGTVGYGEETVIDSLDTQEDSIHMAEAEDSLETPGSPKNPPLGRHTIAYVKSTLATYRAICSICE